MKDDFWYVYILRCSDGSFYTGITNNVEERVREHNGGSGAAYTRERTPVSLVYKERHDNQALAQQREEQIKRWGRQKKENLVLGSPRL